MRIIRRSEFRLRGTLDVLMLTGHKGYRTPATTSGRKWRQVLKVGLYGGSWGRGCKCSGVWIQVKRSEAANKPTLANWHPAMFSCQSDGSLPISSRPSIHITFQQTGQFVGPNPLQYKGHNGAYSGSLSSLDLLLPSGLPHFLIEESAWTDRF